MDRGGDDGGGPAEKEEEDEEEEGDDGGDPTEEDNKEKKKGQRRQRDLGLGRGSLSADFLSFRVMTERSRNESRRQNLPSYIFGVRLFHNR